MAERLDIEDFFREIDPDLCQYAYDFRECGFTSSIINGYHEMLAGARLSESFSIYPQRTLTTDFKHFECESLCYGLLNFKCLMTNHAMFDTQLEHVLTCSCLDASNGNF